MNLSLQELLEKTKKDKNPYYTEQILQNRKVNNIILNTCRRFKVKRFQVKLWIIEYTLKYYKLDESEWCEERYLNAIKKWTGRKAAKENERTTKR